MKKIGVVIADGVGYRNFIMSEFIHELISKYDEVIIYSGLIEGVYDKELLKKVSFYELDIYKESIVSWFFRKLKEVAHMRKHISFFGIKTSYNNGKVSKIKSKRHFLIKIVYAITKVFYSEANIEFYEKRQFKSFSNENIYKKYLTTLTKTNPESLFFTHQRPYNLAPLLAACKVLNIKTSSFIFSWDNLASKGRMLGQFDGYMVWSDLMKKELLHFYPNTIEENVHVVGTPQFEPYVMEKYDVSKEELFKSLGLDLSKKTIYYSCGDVSTSQLDPFYIEKVARFIENKKIIDVNFVVRTSPAEDESRFIGIKKKYHNIVWNFPNWELTRTNHTETWSQRVPSVDDIITLKGLLKYSDVNINMCSTMSLDIMLFDKPVINAVYGNKENGLYNDQKYLNYVHFDKVVKSKAVTVVKKDSDFIKAINNSLSNPTEFQKERANILDIQIGVPLKGTSKRMAKTLLEWS
ncbi:hypothetical protein [Olleya sp. HaHaR_3_96]|uniref:hypothetical protein n=1 Tax=Olleya sp. HaHaR_3_96 TaxID=2745560 RepID=UPI001C4EF905|nr:hypothetical protein [Olleya sp. HaHaR_3_96]QXP61690.1 hypothetical protein H0I26_08685 [Olleya sp. HaHaR_3_96]